MIGLFLFSCSAVGNQLVYRDDEGSLEVVTSGLPWTFDGEGDKFRLGSKALRIKNGYQFDPFLSVRTSLVEALPHQITAVYEKMLPRQPLRYLLADDPAAAKLTKTVLMIAQVPNKTMIYVSIKAYFP